MPRLEVTGAYVGVEAFHRSSQLQDTSRDAAILEALLAASRDVDRLTVRRFYPVAGICDFRWPPESVAASWRIWMEQEDLLSVTAIEVAAGGIDASPIALTHYFLEPQQYGPPYNRVEVDLSSDDVFQAGSTPQRSVQITGQWGFCADTTPAGTLNGDIADSDASLVCSDATRIDQGDVLLIDSEAVYVDSGRDAGSTTLTIQRGVNGTTAAAHTNGAAIKRYRAPASIRRLVLADAIASFQENLAGWTRPPSMGYPVMWGGKALQTLREMVVQEYARVRMAAV